MLVVWSHLSGFWLLSTGNSSSLQEAWQRWAVRPLHLYQNGGHLGVVLFFLISGYIITHTAMRETVWAFVVKRAMRIFPPLAVATGVAGLLLVVADRTDTTLFGVNGGGVVHWASSLVLLDGFVGDVRALDVTWTLVIELFFYALTAALMQATRRRPLWSTWIMVAAWLAVTWVGVSVNVPGINDTLPVYAGVLIVGRVIYLAQRRIVSGGDAALLSVVAGGSFLLSMETLEHGYLIAPGGWPGIEPLVTYALAAIIFLVGMRWNPMKVVQPLRWLGDISYSLYLLHLPVGLTVLNVLSSEGVNIELATLLAILAALAAATVSYLLVERPSQSLARRFVTRGAAAEPQRIG